MCRISVDTEAFRNIVTPLRNELLESLVMLKTLLMSLVTLLMTNNYAITTLVVLLNTLVILL